jgi:hypothetical protein
MGQQRKKNNQEYIDPVEQAALKNAMNNFYAARQNGDAEQIINKNSSTPLGTPIQPQPQYQQPPQPQYQQPQQHYQPLSNQPNPQTVVPTPQPVSMNGFQSPEDFERSVYNNQAMQNVDPNLVVEFEIVPFPSKGLYYSNRIGEVTVEKMTAVDEDILATTSLIENGTVLDILIKRKIKTPGINTDELLVGDRNAVLLFLRASSYGHEYEVRVIDPRSGVPFNAVVDLTKLKSKEIPYIPDERGEFSFQLPMRKKMVKFRILNYKEINHVLKTAEAKQQAYNLDYSEFPSMKLKAEVVEIEGNRNKDYITQFIDALPAKDSAVLKQRINDVTPDVDMNYEFTAADGYKFKAKISVGVDFFFPFI